MKFQLDPEINALYISLRQGSAVRTLELTDTIYVDMDADDAPLGIEFLDANEFIPFLRDHADDTTIPPQVRALFSRTAA